MTGENKSADFRPSRIDKIKNFFYLPVTFCIWSLLNKTETFKNILNEVNNIISIKIPNEESINEKSINNFRIVELLNFCIFITGIANPPFYTNMSLNFSKLIYNKNFRIFSS